jgi:hypothetical protein
MPFKILAIAPFTHQQEAYWSEDPIQVDKTNLDQVMGELGLSFYVPIPKDLCPAGGLDIACKGLKDFHPDGLCQSNAFLKNLLDAKTFVEEANAKGLSAEEMGMKLKDWPNLPPIRINTEHQQPKRTSTSAVDDILKMVALPEEGLGAHAETATLTRQIDILLQQILAHVFSHETFRNLEAVWRGVKSLLDQGGMDGQIRLEIVPASLETLDETMDNLTTRLVQDLPSLIIIDLPFDNSPRSLESLEQIARFGETLLCPTVCWITQKFLYLDTWQELNKLPFLPHYIEEPQFAKWRRLAQTSPARWLAVTCNRFLARYPYGPDNKPRLVHFQESQQLWASPVWAIGCLVSQSFGKTGWPTRFTDWQNIRLEDLALDTSQPNKPIATEASIPEDRIDQFVRAGIMPLVGFRNKDIAFVLEEATVGQGTLSYQAFVARITHFVLWCKDSFEKDLEPAELQKRLEQAFSLFWENSGHSVPKNLEVSVSHPNAGSRPITKILIEPSREILPSGEKVELEFVW